MENVITDRPLASVQTRSEIVERAAAYIAIAIAAVLPISTALTDIFFVLAVVLMLVVGNLRQKFREIVSNRVAVLFLAFFGLYLVGMLYTKAPAHDAFHMLKKFDKFLLAALMFPLFSNEKWRRYALNAFLVVMTAVMVCSYLKYFKLIPYWQRYSGVAVFKNYIAAGFLISMYAFFLAHSSRHYSRYRLAGYVCVTLAVINVMFLNFSRSGYVILFMLWVLFFFQKWRWRGVVVGLLSFALICGLAFGRMQTFTTRVELIGQNVTKFIRGDINTSTGLRLSFTRNSLSLLIKHPLIGAGTGSFRSQYAGLKTASLEGTVNPHNEYIHTGIQFGALGVGLLLLMLVYPWIYSAALPFEYRCLAQGVLLTIAVGSCFNSWLMDTTQGHFFVYFMAVFFAAMPRGLQSDKKS